MATALPPLPFNPARLRSYILRLPLFTRCILLFIVIFWVLGLFGIWDIVQWGSLIPNEMSLGTSEHIPSLFGLNSKQPHLSINVANFFSHAHIQITNSRCECSVSPKHLSYCTPRTSPRFCELIGVDTTLGEV